jgi:5'-3' exonuclease
VRQHKNIVIQKAPPCHRLLIDFNAVVHQSAALLINERPGDVSYENIIKETIMTTKTLISVMSPKDTVYIGVDGVAPRAKMVQQRKRRYLTSYRNRLINDYMEKHAIKSLPDWDSNAITPGTRFMAMLDSELHRCFADDTRVIVSGSNEEGEGEQKLFDFINNNKDTGKVNLIHGMDADLIMLSLLSDQTIYLQRDSEVVDIQAFRVGISKHMRLAIGNSAHDLMRDYVFMCFLLGNDFIPHLPFMRIRDGGINVLTKIYTQVHKEQPLVICHEDHKYSINREMLTRIFAELANNEYSRMKVHVEKFNHQVATYVPRKIHNVKEYSTELENYPKLNKHKLLDIIHQEWHQHDWMQQYYKHLFDSAESNKYVGDYLEGVIWVFNYYFNRKYDRFWYYRHHVAPLASDILGCMNACDIAAMTERLKMNRYEFMLTPPLQLLCVLPPQSARLLPNEHQDLMRDPQHGLACYYPTGFALCTFMKDFMWECTPILPDIDIEKVRLKLDSDIGLS